jgi:hypothetical protein
VPSLTPLPARLTAAAATQTPFPGNKATPTACLDEAAQPIVLPPRQEPLEVRWISSGDLWLWVEGEGEARQITQTGDVRQFSFSPDGEAIALTRRGEEAFSSYQELWIMRRDGSGLRKILSTDDLYRILGDPPRCDHCDTGGLNWYFDGVDFLGWLDGARTVGLEIWRCYYLTNTACSSGGFRKLDAGTGEVEGWTPPPGTARSPYRRSVGDIYFSDRQFELLSPDGGQLAVFDEHALSLVNSDGANLRQDVMTYDRIFLNVEPQIEGMYSPLIFWTEDSSWLGLVTNDGEMTTWRVPADGSPAVKLATFPASHAYNSGLSAGGKYFVYFREGSAGLELHLAFFDGSRDVLYARGGGEFVFQGWADDGFHFVFSHGLTMYYLGSVCGGSQRLLDPPLYPIREIGWVDASRFLFIRGEFGEPAGELRLGEVGEGSVVIGPYITDYVPLPPTSSRRIWRRAQAEIKPSGKA